MANGINGNIKELLSSEKAWKWLFHVSIVAAILYLQLNYVSEIQYQKDREKDAEVAVVRQEALTSINQTLGRIDERMKWDDTKPRLQALEKHVHELEVKLSRMP